MLPSKRIFEIFDPRRGEDFVVQIRYGKKLSMLECEFLTIRFYPGHRQKDEPDLPSLSLDHLNNFIRLSMQALGGKGFFAVTPVTKEVQRDGTIDLNQMDELCGSAIGYFELKDEVIRHHMALRKRLATYAEWVIGSCEKTFEKPLEPKWYQHTTFWNIDLFFNQVDNVNCMSFFNGETGESIFYTRIYPGIDELLAPLQSLVDK